MHYTQIVFIYLFISLGLNAESPKKIAFNYESEDLVNVINYVASQKNINVLLPLAENQKINGKFSWQLDKKITIDEAWNILNTVLDIAGYSIVPKGDFYQIVKNTKEVSREPVPLFVGTNPVDLPPTEQRIRYIYYLANIKLQEGQERQSELNTLLKEMLPEFASFKLDVASNAVLLMAPSVDVRSLLPIIHQLDRPGFQERLEIFSLKYANSRIVSDLFNKQILQNNQQGRYHLGPKKTTEATYFSKHLRLISNDRTNTLIMVGRQQAIERVKSFVQRYIDVKPESGDSILHVYQLQYLEAAEFAKVLDTIVKAKKGEGGTGQSEAQPGSKKKGPQRFFEDVIIAVDTPKQEGFDQSLPAPGDAQEASLGPAKYFGGNNLIIAARGDDWKRIRTLIEDLDQPRPQVLIEVLIADLTLNDSRALGNLMRNAAKLPVPGDINFQSAQLAPGIVPDSYDNPNTIGIIPDGPVADVNRLFTQDSSGNRSDASPSTEGALSVPDLMGAGSTALTLSDSDGKTWSISRILKVLENSKILSHPHVISTDNQEAKIENTEIRLLPGSTKTGTGGAITREQKQVPASLKVAIRPRISSAKQENGEEVGTVNLQIVVDIDEYTSNTADTRIKRNVTTNAIVNSGDILAIGGLIQTRETNDTKETPLLSQIPLIGWLFKDKGKQNRRTNLTVFISPTIIQPRLRGGIGEYTQDYLNLQIAYTKGNLFDSLKDPITRWFFKTEGSTTQQLSDEFMEKDEVHKGTSVPMPSLHQLGKKRGKSGANKLQLPEAPPVSETLQSLVQDLDNPFAQPSQLAQADPQSG